MLQVMSSLSSLRWSIVELRPSLGPASPLHNLWFSDESTQPNRAATRSGIRLTLQGSSILNYS
jgi:hypothetical protein